jgi:hypothetical protein
MEECMSEKKRDVKLRSAEWFETQDRNGFMYRSWMKTQGIPDHEFRGKPIPRGRHVAGRGASCARFAQFH